MIELMVSRPQLPLMAFIGSYFASGSQWSLLDKRALIKAAGTLFHMLDSCRVIDWPRRYKNSLQGIDFYN